MFMVERGDFIRRKTREISEGAKLRIVENEWRGCTRGQADPKRTGSRLVVTGGKGKGKALGADRKLVELVAAG